MADRSEAYFEAYSPVKSAETLGLPGDLIVRPAEMRDVEGLAALHQEREGGVLMQHKEHFQQEVKDNPGWQRRLLLVAENDGVLIGFSRVIYFQSPLDSPANIAPSGWYLAGVIVTPGFRRRGIGAQLTRRRLEWIAERADEAFYFVNAQNWASIALHTGFGFEEMTRDFVYPGASFTGGVGILFKVMLSPAARQSSSR